MLPALKLYLSAPCNLLDTQSGHRGDCVTREKESDFFFFPRIFLEFPKLKALHSVVFFLALVTHCKWVTHILVAAGYPWYVLLASGF